MNTVNAQPLNPADNPNHARYLELRGSSIEKLSAVVHELARSKGFYDQEESCDRYVERACNNLHDEVSELHTAWRERNLHNPCDKSDKMLDMGFHPLTFLEEELADIVIRAMDNAHHLGVDLGRAVIIKHLYNETRSYRHGNKKS